MRALFLLLAAAALPAADQWHRITSEHFELYTTAGERRGKSAVQHFEQIHAFFVQTLKRAPTPPHKIRIIGFSGEKQFKEYRPNETAVAYYTSNAERDYIVMRDLANDVYPIAVHEYAHLLLRHSGLGEMPVWLNEGVAELYSTIKPVVNKVQVGEFRPGTIDVLRSTKWIPLPEMLAAGNDSPLYNERNRSGMFYAQAMALTHMLNLSKEYSPEFSKLLGLLLNGKSAGDAFQAAYGKPLAEVQSDVERYIRQQSYMVAVFDVKMQKAAQPPEAHVIPEAEAHVALASLRMMSGRREQARAQLEAARATMDGNAELHEMLAYLNLYDKRDAEAREHFGKAMAAGATNRRLALDYAYLLETGGDLAAATKVMERVVASGAVVNEDRLRLGHLYLRAKRYSMALNTLLEVKSINESRAARLFSSLAYAYLGLEGWDQAKTMAERATKHPQSLDEKQSMDRLLAWLASRQQYERAAAQAAQQPPVLAAKPEASAITADRPVEASDEDTAARPKLLRRRRVEGIGEVFEETRTGPEMSIEGKFQELDCGSVPVRVTLHAADRKLVLAIEDPTLVQITSTAGNIVELQCGRQPDTTVKIGFDNKIGLPAGVAGVVRTIAFQ